MKNRSVTLPLLLFCAASLDAQTRISLSAVSPPQARATTPLEASPGPSANFAITGPTLGFVFDAAAGLVRRVPGIVGAARIGGALPVGQPLAAAYTAPQQDYILGIPAGQSSPLMISLAQGTVTGMQPLNLVPPAPDRVAFSPSGNSMVLYYQSASRLIALTGVPSAPQIVGAWDLTSYLGDLTALAIADQGDAVLAGISPSSAGVLALFQRGATGNVLLPMTRPSAAQFLWGSHDAVVADQAQGVTELIQDVLGSAQVRTLTRPEDGLLHPDLLAVDRFGQTVLIAQSGGAAGLAVGLSTSSLQPFQCGCVISSLEPLNGMRTYRLTALTAGRFRALDASGSAPAFEWIRNPKTAPGNGPCVFEGSSPRARPEGAPPLGAVESAGCGAPDRREVLQ